MSTRILIIGPLPPPVGGTTVSLAALVQTLRDLGVAAHVVDSTVRVGPLGQLRTLLRAIAQVIRAAPKVDVITCHMSVRGALTAAPIFRILAWLLRKPFVHRQFGGGFHDTYRRLPAAVQWFIRKTLLRSDLVLFQTHRLVRELGPRCGHRVEWFPTARADTGCRYEAGFARRGRNVLRCIFVSHVRPEKGVFEAIAAIGQVESTELHIYGPLVGIREEELSAPRVYYHGALAPQEVPPNLAAADLLLFPTYYPGEGYPGTLVEAALVGLPVVATTWQAIPEMFPQDELILVEPRSTAQIADALRRVVCRQIDLANLSARMRARSSDFDAAQVFGRFAAMCADVSSAGDQRSVTTQSSHDLPMPLHRRLMRVWRTVRYLRARQVANRLLRHAIVHSGTAARPVDRRAVRTAFVEPCTKKDSFVDETTVMFLRQPGRIADAAIWRDGSKPKLWLYQLHYFDDLGAAEASRRTAWHLQLIERWIVENPAGADVGWDPYPISLRVCNWIKWDLTSRQLPIHAVASLAQQVRHLVPRLEYHLLCNHLLANLKALVFAGCYLQGAEADAWRERGLRELQTQLTEQVLDDGGHVELSPMYQAILLEDLLDIVNVLCTYSFDVPVWLSQTCARMLSWCGAMAQPDGDWVQFNDTSLGGAPDLNALSAYMKRLGMNAASGQEPSAFLPASGFARCTRGRLVLFADVGNLGPDYNPAHGHADTLTFELSIDGQRTIVDTGTSTYEVSERRATERATHSHNTVVLDGQNSSEVWSAFRTARRAKARGIRVDLQSSTASIEAEHDGYAWLKGRPIHRRKWLLGDSALTVIDRIDSSASHSLRAHLHLHPRCLAVRGEDGKVSILDRGDRLLAAVDVGSWSAVHVETYDYSPEFGRREVAQRIVMEHRSQGPTELSYSLCFIAAAAARDKRTRDGAVV